MLLSLTSLLTLREGCRTFEGVSIEGLITFVMTAAFGLGGAMAGETVSYVFLNDRIGNPEARRSSAVTMASFR